MLIVDHHMGQQHMQSSLINDIYKCSLLTIIWNSNTQSNFINNI